MMTSGSAPAHRILALAIRVRADSVPLAGYASKMYETKPVNIDMLDQTYTPVPMIGTKWLTVGFAVKPIQNNEATIPRLPIMLGTTRYSSGAIVAMFAQPFIRLVNLSIKLDVKVEETAPTTAAMKASPAWCNEN